MIAANQEVEAFTHHMVKKIRMSSHIIQLTVLVSKHKLLIIYSEIATEQRRFYNNVL